MLIVGAGFFFVALAQGDVAEAGEGMRSKEARVFTFCDFGVVGLGLLEVAEFVLIGSESAEGGAEMGVFLVRTNEVLQGGDGFALLSVIPLALGDADGGGSGGGGVGEFLNDFAEGWKIFRGGEGGSGLGLVSLTHLIPDDVSADSYDEKDADDDQFFLMGIEKLFKFTGAVFDFCDRSRALGGSLFFIF